MRFTICLFLILSPAFLLFGQTDEGWTPRLLMIKSLAETSDREQKTMALSEAETLLKEDPSSEERLKVLEILAFLASEGVTSLTYEGMAPGMSYGTVRAGAAALLGQYGGEESVRPLVDIIFYDDDPLSIGSAASAVVTIDGDNMGNVVLAFSRVLKNTRKVYDNERLIQEVLAAVEFWAERRPEILESEDLLDGLSFCSQSTSGYGRTTRNMASDIIRKAGLSREQT